MPRKEEASLNIISIIIIILAVSVVIASTLTEFGRLGIAQAQGNNNITSSLTPEQRAAMCDPNNPLSMLKSVNTTESRICGIPKTQSSNTTSSENMTTGAEAPSVVPTPPSIPPFQPTG
jgi:hypothetical protein